MDVGLDGSHRLVGGDGNLLVAKAHNVPQDDRLTGARWKCFESPVPGVEVDEFRIVGADLNLSVHSLRPPAPCSQMVATEIEGNRPDPSSQLEVSNSIQLVSRERLVSPDKGLLGEVFGIWARKRSQSRIDVVLQCPDQIGKGPIQVIGQSLTKSVHQSENPKMPLRVAEVSGSFRPNTSGLPATR